MVGSGDQASSLERLLIWAISRPQSSMQLEAKTEQDENHAREPVASVDLPEKAGKVFRMLRDWMYQSCAL